MNQSDLLQVNSFPMISASLIRLRTSSSCRRLVEVQEPRIHSKACPITSTQSQLFIQSLDLCRPDAQSNVVSIAFYHHVSCSGRPVTPVNSQANVSGAEADQKAQRSISGVLEQRRLQRYYFLQTCVAHALALVQLQTVGGSEGLRGLAPTVSASQIRVGCEGQSGASVVASPHLRQSAFPKVQRRSVLGNPQPLG